MNIAATGLISTVRSGPARFGKLVPGILLSLTIALAATHVGTGLGVAPILLALLLGMGFAFLAGDQRLAPGIAFSGRTVLRLGVALLGARITVDQFGQIGMWTVIKVVAAVLCTIGFGALISRALGLSRSFGILTAGATAICGASAAAAISAVLPRHADIERDTAFTIIGVTALSTIIMIAYPPLLTALGWSEVQAGIFLGATIHDVAQVVGAGYSMSETTGDIATLVKLLRVALLVPIVFVLSIIARRLERQSATSGPVPLLPGFLVGFVVLAAISSAGLLPKTVTTAASALSSWCIITAIAAVGLKTSWSGLKNAGHRSIALLVLETVFIALVVFALMAV